MTKLLEASETNNELKSRILSARESCDEIRISKSQVRYLVEESIRAGIIGHRAEIFAVKVAKASAALGGRSSVSSLDLKNAVELTILPRATDIPEQNDTPSQHQMKPAHKEQESRDEEQDSDQTEKQEKESQDQRDVEPEQVPQDFIFQSQGVVIDPSLLKFMTKKYISKGRAGKSRNRVYNEDRGRYVKAMFPKGKMKHIAVDATLRAAAPYQLLRKRIQSEKGNPLKKVYIDKSDLRSKRLARKAGALVMFVVDASGSMALNRMSAAKGAVMQLLSKSYIGRDMISLIPFFGDRAEVLLPPCRSITLAKNRLEVLPCGGGSPLAHGLSLAVRLGLKAKKGGSTDRVLIVLITDGRANVNLAKSNKEPQALAEGAEKPSQESIKEEVLSMARKIQAEDFHLLVIDTGTCLSTIPLICKTANSLHDMLCFFSLQRASIFLRDSQKE